MLRERLIHILGGYTKDEWRTLHWMCELAERETKKLRETIDAFQSAPLKKGRPRKVKGKVVDKTTGETWVYTGSTGMK